MFCSKLNSLFVSLFVCLFCYFQENDTSTTARPATTVYPPPPPKVLDTLSMLIPYGEWEEILAGSSYIGVNRDYPSREWHTTNDNSLSISVNRF